jgi:lipid-binding SYLF domain-containing protein
VFGAEAIDSIIILNTKSSVQAFMGKGQVTFGGNVSLAIGPVGKDIEAHIGVGSNKEIVAAYSYSNARGMYVGGSLEGAFVARQDDENKKYYGNDLATAENLISGKFPPPPKCVALANALDDIIMKVPT